MPADKRDIFRPKQFYYMISRLKSSQCAFGPLYPLGFSGTLEENTWHFEVILLFLSRKWGLLKETTNLRKR